MHVRIFSSSVYMKEKSLIKDVKVVVFEEEEEECVCLLGCFDFGRN